MSQKKTLVICITNMPRKKQVKKAKEEIKVGGVEKEPKNAPAQEGIYELINGYAIVANGNYSEFIGDKVITFNEAAKSYKLKKSV